MATDKESRPVFFFCLEIFRLLVIYTKGDTFPANAVITEFKTDQQYSGNMKNTKLK